MRPVWYGCGCRCRFIRVGVTIRERGAARSVYDTREIRAIRARTTGLICGCGAGHLHKLPRYTRCYPGTAFRILCR